jgi:dienelactone hydrolase
MAVFAACVGLASACAGSAATPSARSSSSAVGTVTSSSSADATTEAPTTTAARTETPKPPPAGTVGRLCDTHDRAPLVHLRASDGARLVAGRYGHGATGIILAHQVDGTLCDWAPFARRLAREGYTALALGFRGFPPAPIPKRHRDGFDLDVVGAANLLRRTGVQRIVLVGASLGGTAVVASAGAIRPQVSAVVSLSGPATYPPVNAVRTVPGLRMPLLFVAARFDAYAADARRMYRAARGRRARLKIFPGGAHGVELLDDPATAPALRAMLLRVIGHARKGPGM